MSLIKHLKTIFSTATFLVVAGNAFATDYTVTFIAKNQSTSNYLCYDFSKTVAYNGAITGDMASGNGCISPGTSKTFNNMSFSDSGSDDYLVTYFYVPQNSENTGTDYSDTDLTWLPLLVYLQPASTSLNEAAYLINQETSSGMTRPGLNLYGAINKLYNPNDYTDLTYVLAFTDPDDSDNQWLKMYMYQTGNIGTSQYTSVCINAFPSSCAID